MNAAHWSTKKALLTFFVLEVAYAFSTRILIHFGDANSLSTELGRSTLRLASAAVLWYLFKPIIETPRVGRWRFSLWWLLPGLALLGCGLVPILCGNWQLDGTTTRLVFAVTSLAVGLREELAYRGILQTLLEKKLGLAGAIAVTTSVFAIYHYGAQPWTWFTVSQYIAFGVILGLLYAQTRSLWLVIWIHTIYDALFCYTPMIQNPWEPQRTIPFLAAAALLVLTWFIFSPKKVTA